MKCHKCRAILTKDDDFCPECGARIQHEKKEDHEDKVKKEHKVKELKLSKKTIFISSVIIGLLVVASVIIFTVPFSYQATQQYIEKVPYDAQESYTEKEPFKDCTTKQASYSVEWGEWLNDRGSDYVGIEILVTNNEKESLSFSFKLAYYDTAYFGWCENTDYSKANMYSEVMYKTIPPYQTKSYQFYTKKKNSDAGYCPMYYGEYIPSIEQCETNYRDVTKYRTVTKYKEDYKERKVTKYATLFDRWSGKIKWYYAAGEE